MKICKVHFKGRVPNDKALSHFSTEKWRQLSCDHHETLHASRKMHAELSSFVQESKTALLVGSFFTESQLNLGVEKKPTALLRLPLVEKTLTGCTSFFTKVVTCSVFFCTGSVLSPAPDKQVTMSEFLLWHHPNAGLCSDLRWPWPTFRAESGFFCTDHFWSALKLY